MPKELKLIARNSRSKIAPVAKSWTRIEKWLKKQLPEGYDSLAPGLSEQPIASFEKVIGQELPADFRESLSIHDGQQRDPDVGVILGLRLLSLHEESLEEWRFTQDQMSSAEPGKFKDESFPEDAVDLEILNTSWIPVAADWGGNFLAIDLDPKARGTRGQVINYGRDEHCKCVLARSWGQFLGDVADELEQGNFVISENDGRPWLSMKAPKTALFFDNCMPWSKAKLGLDTLTKNELALWKRFGKFQGWASAAE